MPTGLFETMRCYQGRVFLLKEHLSRLQRSCPVLGIEFPMRKELEEAVFSVIEKNHIKNATLRLSVVKQKGKAGIFVFSKKLVIPSAAQYRKGFSVILEEKERITPSSRTRIKQLDHHFYNRLTKKAKMLGFDEAVFLNAAGEVVEGSRTNIFLVRDNKVMTPALSCGCLPGITRAKAVALLKKSKIPVTECRILAQELFLQDEIFVTNSLLGVIGVTLLNKKPLRSKEVGPLTKNIMRAYQNEVEKECFLS